jgi:hypothetical protein
MRWWGHQRWQIVIGGVAAANDSVLLKSCLFY